MAVWHAETVLHQLRLRRYQGDDARAAFDSRTPYDGVGSVEIKHGRAWVDGMLVSGPPLTRDDWRQIRALLQEHGARVLDADRHGRLVERVR